MCLIHASIPMKFVAWVRECITNPRYFLTLNGSMVGYFNGGKDQPNDAFRGNKIKKKKKN